MAVLLAAMAIDMPPDGIFPCHFSNYISTITAGYECYNVDCRWIYRQLPVHWAIVRPPRRSVTWCMVWSNMVVFTTFCSVSRVARRANFSAILARSPVRPIWPPTSATMADDDESNDTNVETWPQWTNACEMGRWFDDLITAGTIIGAKWTFN